jgi:alpha-1,2-mannosyltransferase
VTTDFATSLRPRGRGRGDRPRSWTARPAAPRARVLLVAVNLAAAAFFLLSFSRHGVGLWPYRIDLDVYRIGGQVWLHGGNLYGTLPATASGVRLPFSYPPAAAILLSPLSLVPMAVAGTVLTLGTIALAAVVLRVFLRSLGPAGGAGSWWTVGWLLPAALFLEPVRNTLGYGQVNVALMALVSLDGLAADVRWPRGALVGIAAAVKLTPGAFVLFFLLRRDYRAAATAALAFAVGTGAGFLLAPGDSARYWTTVVTATSRPGSPAYAANQSIAGVLARAGLDPHSPAGTAAWLALSAAVLGLACLGMRRALAGAADAWALSLNAFAALLVSPISWSHHWVWGETAMLTLAVLSVRYRRRAALVAAVAGIAVFAAAPQWWFPSGENRELHWAAWQQVTGSAYVILAVAALLLSARCSWPASSGCYQATRDISWAHRWCPRGGTGFRRALWLRDMRCGSVTRSGKPRRLSYASTSPAGDSTRTSSMSGSPRCSPPRRGVT